MQINTLEMCKLMNMYTVFNTMTTETDLLDKAKLIVTQTVL